MKWYNKELQTGDVLNYPKPRGGKWYMRIAYWGIECYQRVLLGNKSRWRDIHTMMYFDDEHIFSVEPPKTCWKTVEELKDKKISVYRYDMKLLTYNDKCILRDVAESMIGLDYDKPQLLDIMINQMLGYPFKYRRFFDMGKKYVVCSVGVATIFQKWRKTINTVPRLFSKLNKKNWSKRFIRKFKKHENRWSVETVCPALFANTKTHFNKEFKKI